MKEQETAVEFMVKNIIEDQIVKKSGSEWEEIFNKSKKMFEEQIDDAHLDGQINWEMSGKQYYNKTFKSE